MRFLYLSHLLYGICVKIFILWIGIFQRATQRARILLTNNIQNGASVVSTITSSSNRNWQIWMKQEPEWRYDRRRYVVTAVLKQLQINPKKFGGFNGSRTHGFCVRAKELYLLSYEDPYIRSRPICWVYLNPWKEWNISKTNRIWFAEIQINNLYVLLFLTNSFSFFFTV